MRAFAITHAGSSPAVVTVPDPIPGPGQILVRVHSGSVNGFDTAVAAGRLEGMMEHRYPVVLGKDFAGTVEGLGDGASRFSVGDKIFGVVMAAHLGEGGLGELLVVGEANVASLPPGVELAAAGALGLAGAAALDAVASARLAPGSTVLISGATGGVGALAVQYAAAAGATVIATARSGEETDFVLGLGADHSVDYNGDLPTQVREITAEGLDAVIHLAGDPASLVDLLKEGGVLASTLGFGPDQHPAAVAVMANPSSHTLTRLADDVAAGRLRVPITVTYPLDEADEGFARFGQGALGKIAISVVA